MVHPRPPTRPRILYVQPCSSFGGAERQASLSVPRLTSLGFDVLPLVGPGDTIVSWLQENGVDDLVLSADFPGGWPRPRGLARMSLLGRYWRCLRRVRAETERLVRSRRIDLIFAAMPFSWLATTRVARKAGIPVIWRAGGTEAGLVSRTVLSAWATLRPPDLLVCCGDAVQRMYGPLVRSPSVVIANGVDTDTFRPGAGDARRFRPADAQVVIGFAGRLVPQKRPEDIIRTAARIAARHPDAVFLIAGDGSRRAAYAELARSLNVERQVRFLGYVADMQSFYAACDIFVLPSRAEGCPNVVLESMAMRRAVIVSDAPGTREVITDGRNGLVYRVGDLDALASAATRLIEQPDLRRALIDRAHQRVHSAFSTQANTRRLADVMGAAIDLGTAARRLPVPHPQPVPAEWAGAAGDGAGVAEGGGRG